MGKKFLSNGFFEHTPTPKKFRIPHCKSCSKPTYYAFYKCPPSSVEAIYYFADSPGAYVRFQSLFLCVFRTKILHYTHVRERFLAQL